MNPYANSQTQITTTRTPSDTSGLISRKRPGSAVIAPIARSQPRRVDPSSRIAPTTSIRPAASHQTPRMMPITRIVCMGERRQSRPTTSASAPNRPTSARELASSDLDAIASTSRNTPVMISWMPIRMATTLRVSSGQTARTSPRPTVTRP